MAEKRQLLQFCRKIITFTPYKFNVSGGYSKYDNDWDWDHSLKKSTEDRHYGLPVRPVLDRKYVEVEKND